MRGAAAAMGLLLAAAAAAAQPPTLSVSFEGGHPWAATAAGNPFPLGSGWDLAPGREGQGLRISADDGYLAFDATSNVPHQRGTIALQLRSGEPNIFTDGQRHCIFALPRSVTGMFATPERWETAGLALSLRKTEANTLDLLAHPGGAVHPDGWAGVPLVSADVAGLSPADWHRIAVSWDWAVRAVTLVIDGEPHAGTIPEQLTEPWPYHVLILGNTGGGSPLEQEPLGATIDDLVVLGVAWVEAQALLDAGLPAADAQPTPPDLCAAPKLFPEDATLGKLECICRRHLEALVRAQEQGESSGWNLAITWPSLICVMGGKARLPETDGYFLASKDNHTAFGALLLAWGYEALGDERYLQAAERTGQMYLQTQSDEGWWINSYVFEDGAYVPTKSAVWIQDHALTGPMMLLMQLHRLTGKTEYRDAAVRCADFLVRIQNPNGSWSHHYDQDAGVAMTARGTPGGGEINDYGTSGPIEALICMHRLTGKPEYRAAALRGADWQVEVFIDNGQVAGWAAQYDDQNRPVVARNFEPASVATYGARWAAPGLCIAYAETRDDRYLTSLRRAADWLEAQQVEPGRWWDDHEIETGRPIAMHANQIYYLDDPAQVQAYTQAAGRPAATVTSGRPDILRNLANAAMTKPWGAISGPPTVEGLQRSVPAEAQFVAEYYLTSPNQSFRPEPGMFLYDAKAGPAMTLHPHQVVRLLGTLMRARAARGEVPVGAPMLRRIEDSTMHWNAALPVPEGL